MEILNTIAMVIGYVTIAVIILGTFIMLFDFAVTNNGWMVSFGGFGIMYAKGKTVRENIAKIRKHTNYNRALYITAPTWFNRNVWNIGGSKVGE